MTKEIEDRFVKYWRDNQPPYRLDLFLEFVRTVESILLTPPADVQERANEIEEPDYTMSDIKEHNPDYTGNKASKDAEDYAANILTEYPDEEYVRRTPSDIRCIAEAAHLAGASSLQAENERLKRLLHDLTPGGSEFYNDPERCAKWIRESRDEAHYSMSGMIKKLKDENEQLNSLNKQ